MQQKILNFPLQHPRWVFIGIVVLTMGLGAAIPWIRIDTDPQARNTMMEITQRRTVPQIFIGDTHVGGCDDLMALDSRGGLVPLLQGA